MNLAPTYIDKVFVNPVFESPQTADWIMRPENSKAHLGIEDERFRIRKKSSITTTHSLFS